MRFIRHLTFHAIKPLKLMIGIVMVLFSLTGCRTIQQQGFRRTSDNNQYELILSASYSVKPSGIQKYIDQFILEHMSSESFNTYTLEKLIITERLKNICGIPTYYHWVEADYKLEHRKPPQKAQTVILDEELLLAIDKNNTSEKNIGQCERCDSFFSYIRLIIGDTLQTPYPIKFKIKECQNLVLNLAIDKQGYLVSGYPEIENYASFKYKKPIDTILKRFKNNNPRFQKFDCTQHFIEEDVLMMRISLRLHKST